MIEQTIVYLVIPHLSVISYSQYPGDQVDLSSRHIVSTNHNLSPDNSFNFIPFLSKVRAHIHGSTLFQGTPDTSNGWIKVSSTAYAEGTKIRRVRDWGISGV